MATEIKVPALGESVTEATVAKWFKKVGDAVAMDEALCELETDKVTVEVNSTAAGALAEIRVNDGETTQVGAVLCVIAEGAAGDDHGCDEGEGTGSGRPLGAVSDRRHGSPSYLDATQGGAANDRPVSAGA